MKQPDSSSGIAAMTNGNPNNERAVRHHAMALNYRRQSALLLEREGDRDCAAALAYESAKQCINAVANQRGDNPGSTGAKVNALRSISELEQTGTTLMGNWRAATQLHIHADRGHLTATEFMESWQQAQAFINAMLSIYHRNG